MSRCVLLAQDRDVYFYLGGGGGRWPIGLGAIKKCLLIFLLVSEGKIRARNESGAQRTWEGYVKSLPCELVRKKRCLPPLPHMSYQLCPGF